MCIYDTSKDKVEDKCQSVEKLERDLSNGDELLKCGACYGDFNIFTRPDDINECSAVDDGAVPCGTDKKKDESKFPMCVWDGKKKEPRSVCGTVSKVEKELLKKNRKHGDILLDCGFCDELNLFEGYHI